MTEALKKLLRIAVSVVLLGWIGWTTDWPHVREAFAALRFEYWLAALALMILIQPVSAARWRLFTRELRFQQRLPTLVGLNFVGMFFNLVLPTSVGGDVVRAWHLDGGSNRKLAALATVFLDRLNGLLVLIALACAAVILSPTELPGWITLAVAGVVSCAVCGIAALPLALRWGLVPAQRVRQMETMVTILRSPRTLCFATMLSLFVQAANVVVVWLVGQALAAPIPAAYYWIFVPMVGLLTMLPVSVNGMGVREGGMVLFLAPLGVASATALTLSFLWFALHVACSLVGGAVYMLGAFGPARTPAQEVNHGLVHRSADQGRTRQSARAA